MGGFKRRSTDREDSGHTAVTLGRLAEDRVDVFCWCNRCGHNAVLPVAQLIGQLGAALAVPEVGARLRCSGCSGKDVATRPAWPSRGPITRHTASRPADP